MRYQGCLLDSPREVYGRLVGDDLRQELLELHQRFPVGAAQRARQQGCRTRGGGGHRLHQGHAPRSPCRQHRECAPLHRFCRCPRFRCPAHRGVECRLGRLVRQRQGFRLRLSDAISRFRPACAEQVCPRKGYPAHYAPRKFFLYHQLRAMDGKSL